MTTVTWTITDLCETISTITANFNLTAPTAVTWTAPSDANEDACDYADQAAVDQAFTAWIAAQSAAIAPGGGCAPQLSNGGGSAPALCTGGMTTVTWTITDLCETISTITANFNLTAPTAVTWTAPSDANEDACDYADQAAVDQAFTAWIAAQSAAIAPGGGCTPQLSNGGGSAPALCAGGMTTVTWTITDLCETISTITANFNLTAPTAVTWTAPSDANEDACDYADQAAVDQAFTAWIAAQSAAIAPGGGCTPQLSNGGGSAPALCAGGMTTVTWTITDLCETISTITANFNLTAPTAVTWTAPSDANEDACDYADQAAVDQAFTAWIAAQSAAIAPGGGCTPQLSNGGGSAPALCAGGITTVTWTITDLCETISTISASFNLMAPTAVTWTAPSDANEDACDYADQAAVDQAFTAWIAAQSAAIAPGGGCTPQLSNGGGSAPALCTGGMTTVTWTITDLCETISTISASFNLMAPNAVTWTAPSDANENACDYADQVAVDAAFTAWIAAQSAAIAPGGGCTPQLSNGGGSAPALCAGGITTVTWTITDLCETISTITANFNLTAPTAVTWTAPSDANEDACDYADQAAVDAAFSAWIAAQSAAIAPGGGCTPQLSNGGGSAPALCAGGMTTVTWTITDLCETISTITANFNLTAPTAVTWTAPSDANEDACDYADQVAVDQAFTAWIAAQSAAIAPGGGCTPQLSNGGGSAPALCTGGMTTVTWTITDLCETISTISASFNLMAPNAVTWTAPSDANENACDYADQVAVDAAFTAWIAAQSAAIAPGGGCTPQLSNGGGSAPALCAGGITTVTWTITDLCETISTITANFNLTAPTAVTWTAPSDANEDACDYADQAAVDQAFTAWIAAQSAAIAPGGGCTPQLSNGGGSAPALCAGGMTTVTWTITDLCETISTISANFNLTAPSAVTWTAPSDANEDACDYADQAAVDAAFTAWIAAQSAAIAPGGGCDPQLSNGGGSAPALCAGGMTTVTWTITDLCETISTITANFNLTAPTAVTWTAPSDANEDACDYADQAAVDQAFTAWIAAQSAAIAPGGGCDPQLSNGGGSAPALCTGGMTMVSWTITDLCETISTITANFNLTAPTAVTWTAPSDANEDACDYADQAAVDQAFTAWIAAQSAAIAPGGGCTPQLSNGGGSAPALCTGGMTMVSWTITDLCETISTITANFNLTAPTAVTWTAPSDANEDACDYADQAAVDQAFTAWIAAQSAAIAPGGGCTPQLSNGGGSAPALCAGGMTTVTWTITDLCETISTITANFNLTAPTAVTWTAPSDANEDACDYADQAAVDQAFTAWIAAQSAAIAPGGGCTPQLSNGGGSAPALCTGGMTMVSWTITDLCETISTISASFNLMAPNAVTWTAPSDANEDACDYADQAAVDAAFSAWIAAQSAAIAPGGGCTPQLSNGGGSAPALCTGGMTTVTWTITDLCETISTISANFNLTAAPAITISCPADATEPACQSQAAIDAAFSNWLSQFTGGGGCNATGSFSPMSPTAPSNCGGVTVVTWTVDDSGDGSICTSPMSCTRSFTVNLAPAITISCPADVTEPACQSQAAIDAAFASWILAFSGDGGCGVVNGSYSVTGGGPLEAPSNCGGAIEVTWTVDDNGPGSECTPPMSCTRSFTVTDAPIPSFDIDPDPIADITCLDELPEQQDITASTTCGPLTVVKSIDPYTVDICNGYSVTHRWMAMDDCGNSIETTRTFNVNPVPLKVECSMENDNKSYISVECSDDIFVSEADIKVTSCSDYEVMIFAVDTLGTPDCPNATYRFDYVVMNDCGEMEILRKEYRLESPAPAVSCNFGSYRDEMRVECFDEIQALLDLGMTTVETTIHCGLVAEIINFRGPFVPEIGPNCDGQRYEIEYSLEDSCGRYICCIRTIIIDNDGPVFEEEDIPEDVTVLCDQVPSPPMLEASFVCEPVGVKFDEYTIPANPIGEDYVLVRTWTADDNCAETTSVSQRITVVCNEVCTFTQGFWGVPNGKDPDGLTTQELLDELVTPQNPVIVGAGNNILTIEDGECIIELLPAGGPSSAFPGNTGLITINEMDCDVDPIPTKRDGTLRNTLAGQVIALTLNIRYDPDSVLCNLRLIDQLCAEIHEDVIEELDDPEATVCDLLELANEALGGELETPKLFDKLNESITNINEYYNQCAPIVCNQDFAGTPNSSKNSSRIGSEQSDDQAFKLWPNPTHDEVNVLLLSKGEQFADIRIVDHSGRVYHTEKVEFLLGENIFTFDVSEMPARIYYIQIHSKDELLIGRFAKIGLE